MQTNFEALADPVHYKTLSKYEPIVQGWVYITGDLSLGEVALVFNMGTVKQVDDWVKSKQIVFYQQLEQVPGDFWMVIWMEPFYIMKSPHKTEPKT